MPTSRLMIWIQTTTLACLATGCTPFQSGAGKGQPMVGSRPGPLKQFATTLGESKIGQSFSNAFKMSPAKTHVEPGDPVSLDNKAKPADAQFYVSLGKVKEDGNDPEGAREAYHKALKMHPHHLGALVGLGRIFEKQGQLDRATQHYLEATRFHQNNASAFNDLGMCFVLQRRYGDSLAALTRAIELQPDRALYRNNIATVLVKLNRIAEAVAHLTDAHGAAVAHYNVGYLLHLEQRDQMALEHFQMALARQPTLDAAQQWIDTLSTVPSENSLPVGIAESDAAEEYFLDDSQDEPSAYRMARPEREPLPGSKGRPEHASWSAERPENTVVARQPADDGEDTVMVSDGQTPAIGDQYAAVGDPDETVAVSDQDEAVAVDRGQTSPASHEARRNERIDEARLQPLPPVERKHRVQSRY